MILFCMACLALAFVALHEARRAYRERDKMIEAGERIAELADLEHQTKEAELLLLEAENKALREQLRRKGVLVESMFDSAKRFHRARFERGVEEILRCAQKDRVDDPEQDLFAAQ